MVRVYALDGLIPVIDPTSFVHPSAALIGDVIIGPNCYIGPQACLRGDFGRILIEQGANVQDCCIIHGHPDGDTLIEEDGHIGHGAVLHCCVVRRNAMVGIGAVVMDNAEIGEEAMIAAQSFVKVGMIIPPRVLAAGIPAKIIRELSPAEIKWKSAGTSLYKNLTERCLSSFRECDALSSVEAHRPRLPIKEIPRLEDFK
jgi:phenylacetic acid degradation protein